jgi:hypothetical protein
MLSVFSILLYGALGCILGMFGIDPIHHTGAFLGILAIVISIDFISFVQGSEKY